jgi:hypothetical protein
MNNVGVCTAMAERDILSGRIRFLKATEMRSPIGGCGIYGRWFSDIHGSRYTGIRIKTLEQKHSKESFDINSYTPRKIIE